MSLVNRQNYTPTYNSWNVANQCPAVIETPSSLWIRGYEHDPSTLTPSQNLILNLTDFVPLLISGSGNFLFQITSSVT